MMKKLFMSLLFCITVLPKSDAQGEISGSDSLCVYSVIDENISLFLDSFIHEAKSNSNFSEGSFVFYLDLYENGNMFLTMYLINHSQSPDSILLYKNPYYHQNFVLFKGLLIQANFRAYNNVLNFCKLTKMFSLDFKQNVYFKKPPPDFFDTRLSGEIDIIIGHGYDYYKEHWHEAIKIEY